MKDIWPQVDNLIMVDGSEDFSAIRIRGLLPSFFYFIFQAGRPVHGANRPNFNSTTAPSKNQLASCTKIHFAKIPLLAILSIDKIVQLWYSISVKRK